MRVFEYTHIYILSKLNTQLSQFKKTKKLTSPIHVLSPFKFRNIEKPIAELNDNYSSHIN